MRTMSSLLLACFLLQLGLLESILNPEEFPNLLAGSFTDGGKFSTGNTLPLVGMPWGFNHWAPQSRDRGRNTGSWWFSGNEQTFTWLRCTHQPSPWIGDWGYFHFTPQLGDMSHSPVHFWQPRAAYIKPHVFDAVVAPNNIRIQLSPTDHGAMLQVTFPAGRDRGEKRICFASARWQDHSALLSGGHYITGEATQVSSDRMLVSNFALRIRAESPAATAVDSSADMICFRYPIDATVVTVRMATSLISPEQAKLSLDRELGKKSFDDVYSESKAVWNKLLRRVNVLDAGVLSGESSEQLIIFYTGLYRALTFPRRLDEIDKHGNVVHYSPYDRSGRTFNGPLVTDNGLWDTFRTVYPLLSLAYPDHLGNIVQGWLNAYKEGGWLPSWASPGYRNCMVGTFADVVIADAIVKDIQCFDINTAIQALSKDAYEEGPKYAGGAVGKEGLSEYISRGYLPSESGGEVVSRTLDYGFADYSTSQAFLHIIATKASTVDSIGIDELETKAKQLVERAVRSYTSLFDKGRGLMVPKDRLGRFSSRFSAIEWGNGYTEGNSWHHSFPSYSITCAKDKQLSCQGGLMALYGGQDALLQKLHALLSTSSHFQVGSYHQEIHEMTEMRAFAMGQYGHNNQPVHHILYLFALLGDAKATQQLVREVLDKGYGVDFYAGDEDNGEQGAWYVLSALGLYSVTPGSPDYVLGSPLFPHVRIARSDANSQYAFASCIDPAGKAAGAKPLEEKQQESYLDIFALGTDPQTVYVHKVLYDGAEVTAQTIDNDRLMRSGVLRFVMEGEAVDAKDNEKLLRKHRASSEELEAAKEDEGDGSQQGSEAAALQSKIHDQQEHIDQLQLELSREKALGHQGANAAASASAGAIHSDNMIQGWIDSVCYLGLLLVAVLTVCLMLRAIWLLFKSESSDAISSSNAGASRWRCWSQVAGGCRGWSLWVRSKLGFSSSSLPLSSDSGKPVAYTV